VTRVAIMANTVAGVDAYWASCLDCSWRCHKVPHDTQAQAVRCAERHSCQA